ncbi:MAG: POTRA domain-containing protein [Chitinophagaceae bacterium]
MQHLGKYLSLTTLIVCICCTTASAQVDSANSNLDLDNIFKGTTPKEYRVGTVVVTGNKYFDQALLLSIANINTGDKAMIPGTDLFSKAIASLWAQNYFSDVVIYITRLEQPNILHLEIAVQERPRLGNFLFKNIKKSDQEDLIGKAALVKGRVITESMKQNAVEAITKFYTEKGYGKIKVDVTETPSTNLPNHKDLVFFISKGTKIKVENLTLAFNRNVPDAKLKKQFKGTKEMGRLTLIPNRDTGIYEPKHVVTFSHFVKNYDFLKPTKIGEFLDPYFRFKPFVNAKFNKEKYEEDKLAVVEYYNSKGYRDAYVEDDTMYYNKNGNLNIDVKVNEGHRYYFGNIAFRGNTKYGDSILNVVLGIRKGDVYNLELLNKKLGKQLSPEGGDISGLYMDDGYLFFRTEVVESAVYNDTIDHEIRLVEGPQATIKNVRIAGNDKTKEYVIRRSIRTLPGDKFSRQDLIRSQREIANLGFFNQEKIGINPIPNQEDGTVDINYTVEEKSADQLELSAGWGGGIGLTGTLGVSFNNFSLNNIFKKDAWDPLPTGDGQKLSLRLQSNGRAFRSYNFSFTEPWLGGKKQQSLTVSVYNTKYANAYDPTTGTYTNTAADNSFIMTTGLGVSLGKQLKWPDDFFSLSYSLNYTRYRLKNYAILPDFSNGLSSNISFKVSLQRSSVDQPVFPRSGSNFLLSMQLTPPYSLWRKDADYTNPTEKYKLVEFHKWRFTGEWFVPLTKGTGEDKSHQFVLRFAAKAGFIGRYNKKLEISPFERFQVGDAGLSNSFALLGYEIISHRGYPVYENSDPKINPDQSGASKYFTIFNKYTTELRYPFSTNPSSTIYAMAWAEAANGWYTAKEYNPFKLRRSIGLGMRFFLPMFGLLGFDYGVGLDRLQPGQGLKSAAKFTFMLGFEPE